MALGAYTPQAVRALGLRGQAMGRAYTPKPPKSTKTKTPTGALLPELPQMLDQAAAYSQVEKLLAPIFKAQDDRINAQFSSQSDAIRQAYAELAQIGQGVGPAIQGVYSNAGKDTAAFAKGFSDAIGQLSGGKASEATAGLAAQGSPQSVQGIGAGGTDALYAMGGSIPASQLAREGAAFASAASFLPSTAAGLGANALRDLDAERRNALLELETDRPKTTLDMVVDMLKAQGNGGSASNLTSRNLANGQIQWFDPTTGQPVGKPVGPPKPTTGSSSPKLTSRTLANGQVQWFDPTTGRAVGKPVGPPRQKGKPSAASKNLQARTLADGRIQWFNPKTGQPVGKPVGPPRQPKTTASQPSRVDEGGRLQGRTDGVTPTQARDYKQTAFLTAKQWHKNGGKVNLGDADNPDIREFTPMDILKFMVNEGNVPYDLAVRQLARFSPAARKWLKSGVNPITGRSTRSNRSVSAKQQATYTIPVSWNPTHESDGLGWGTRSAIDLFPGPPGTTVGSPVSGTVVYWHPTGAQGGGSMLIRGDDGYEYWVGHIARGVKAGTRVGRGSKIAVVSSDHETPHVHVDRRRLGGLS